MATAVSRLDDRGGPGDESGQLSALLLPLGTVAAVLGLWELGPRVGWLNAGVVPPVSEVLILIPGLFLDPTFLPNMAASAYRWALGFALAILIGVPLGALMGRSRLAFHLIDPILTVSYPVPRAALILILVLWFGAGDVSRVGIIILGCLIPIVISSYHGAKGINPHLLWSARALGTGRAAALLKVVLPAALPQVLSGLRLAIAISIFTLLASELLIRQSGIGAYLFTLLDNGQYHLVWACSAVIATIGFLIDAAYVRLVRRGMPWLEGEV